MRKTNFLDAHLLDHLILVLDEQLDPLDGGGGGLRHAGSHAGEHERLEESKLLFSHNEVRVAVSEIERITSFAKVIFRVA